MPSVSVVIPCYNYGRYLEQAVASVLDYQPGLDVRVLVIDDASPDGSGATAQAIAAREHRAEAVVHTSNKGHIATYNEGLLGWADGDYSVLLSADDLLTPGALRRAVDLLEAHPSVGFAYGYAQAFRDDARPPTPRTTPHGWSIWPGSSWIERRCRLGRSGIFSPEVVVRTSLQQAVGGYNPQLPHHADTEMWMRLAARADVGYLRGVDQALYRKHPQNMSLTYDPLAQLHQARVAFETILEQNHTDLVDASRLTSLVHRKLAWEALFVAARGYDGAKFSEAAVDELVAFALECWPQSRTMPVYRALRLRRSMGPGVMSRLRPLVPPERGVRFLAEAGDRYDSVWEAVDAVARPWRQSVRFA